MERSGPSAEVLIVGGGVIGLSLAFELLGRGRGVHLLDAGMRGMATRAAAGMLAPVSEAEQQRPEIVALGQDSLSRYPEFISRLESTSGSSCRYATEGCLWVAVRRDHRGELEHLAVSLETKGFEVARLTGEEVARLEPHLSPKALCGLQLPQDRQLDPRALCHCLEAAVDAMGGKRKFGVTIERIDTGEGGFVVTGRDRAGRRLRFENGQVALAAGAWSARGLRTPLTAPGLRPVKGQLVRLRGARLLRHVVRTPEVYLVPRADGELLVGSTVEEMGFDTSASAGGVMDLLRHAWEVLPGLYDLELSEISVGLRSAVDDHLPVIGQTRTPGLFAAFGHFRNGVLLAPATARHLAECIVSGVTPPELEPFSPARLTESGVAGQVSR